MDLLAGLKSINVILRFLLELCSLFAMGYWGYKTGNGPLLQWIFAIGAPLMMAVMWGAMGSPKAPIQLSGPLHSILEIVVFGLPVILLFSLGKTEIAWVLGCTVVINKILMIMWKQ